MMTALASAYVEEGSVLESKQNGRPNLLRRNDNSQHKRTLFLGRPTSVGGRISKLGRDSQVLFPTLSSKPSQAKAIPKARRSPSTGAESTTLTTLPPYPGLLSPSSRRESLTVSSALFSPKTDERSISICMSSGNPFASPSGQAFSGLVSPPQSQTADTLANWPIISTGTAAPSTPPVASPVSSIHPDRVREFGGSVPHNNLKEDLAEAKLEHEWVRKEQQYQQYIESMQLEKEEIVRNHTIETGDLRKKVSVLTDHIQRLEATTISAMPSSIGFSTDYSDIDSLTMDSAWDNIPFLNDFAPPENEVKVKTSIVPIKNSEKGPKLFMKDTISQDLTRNEAIHLKSRSCAFEPRRLHLSWR